MATLTSKIYENITLNGNDLGAYTTYNIDNINNNVNYYNNINNINNNINYYNNINNINNMSILIISIILSIIIIISIIAIIIQLL